ncbi:MSHA biogenesis protein MshK [Vibrio sp. HN007]|uniref:MSHA biogenesis protein MshK n=1 Tax=Vibrio iocasae TaxID=3098914 RepID=UPI0035D51BE7
MVSNKAKISCLLMATFCLLGNAVYAADDPTAPLDWAQPKVTSKTKVKKKHPLPSVQSIVCEKDKDGCYAIVNSKIVNRGEVINGFKIKNITSEKVDVTRSGKQWELRVFPLDIKQ